MASLHHAVMRRLVTAALMLVLVTGAIAARSESMKVSPGGELTWARAYHSATLLSDGRVLLAGGSSFRNESPIPWAEVCDPEARTCTPTGALSLPRSSPASVLLHDGRVLIAGGWRAGYVVATDTLEAWDPRARSFSVVGALTPARGYGIAPVVLENGTVLLIGGRYDGEFGTASDAIDAFDPSRNACAPWGRLVMSRNAPAVRLIDAGHVLVAGGNYRCCSAPAGPSRTRSQEICDLGTHACGLAEDLPPSITFGAEPQDHSCVALSDDEMLCGRGSELARWRSGQWSAAAPPGAVLLSLRSRARARGDLALVARLLALQIELGLAEDARVLRLLDGQSVTPLQDGRVLIAGGLGPDLRASRSTWIVEVTP